MSVILSSLYNAPIQYYSKLLFKQSIVLDVYENYVKQTYRNRCVIYSADGPMSLSIPVNYSSSLKEVMKDITISYQSNWIHLHWNAIVSAYNSTPFFEYYRDDFECIYRKKNKYLLDFNNDLLDVTLKYLKLKNTDISYSASFCDNIDNSSLDYRNIIVPKKDLIDSTFSMKPYYQAFSGKHGFLENLSILDLLFNMGNESIIILQNSISNINNYHTI